MVVDGKVKLRGVRIENGGTYKPGVRAIKGRQGDFYAPLLWYLRHSELCIDTTLGHAVQHEKTSIAGHYENNVLWQSLLGSEPGMQVINNAVTAPRRIRWQIGILEPRRFSSGMRF